MYMTIEDREMTVIGYPSVSDYISHIEYMKNDKWEVEKEEFDLYYYKVVTYSKSKEVE